jgi:hypothetical protein
MNRHLALVTSKREATLKPRAEGIAWIGILISFLSSSFHQKRPGRAGVCWQELAPPDGELTHKTMDTIAIKWLHGPLHTTSTASSFPIFALLNEPQVL